MLRGLGRIRWEHGGFLYTGQCLGCTLPLVRYVASIITGFGSLQFFAGWIGGTASNFDGATLLRILIGSVLLVGRLIILGLLRIEEELKR